MHTKRIAAGYNKGRKWAPTPRGPHRKRDSMPLIDFVKHLGLADKTGEAKKIITSGLIMVDGSCQRDYRYGLGLMDVVSIPTLKKQYRLLPDKKGLTYRQVGEKEAKTKLCRVVGKTLVADGKVQVNLHDGSNMITDRDVNVNETVIVEVPKMRIVDSIPYAVGNQAMVVSGRHRGETGVVEEVFEATGARKSLTTIGGYQTLTDYVFIIGKEKPVITV
jgi:small subunit ribosomal protein S4e